LRKLAAWNCSDRRFCGFRGLDVASDLGDEFLLARESTLVSQSAPELDDQPLAVEVAFEIEQERLHAALMTAVVRVRPDRDRGAVPLGPAGIDAVGGHEQRRLDAEIRSRVAERPAARVAG